MKKKLSLLMVALMAVAAFAATMSVTVSRRAVTELTVISEATTWDFSKLTANTSSEYYASEGIKLTDASTPTKNDEFIYANYLTTFFTADASFKADAIAFKGEYPIRKDKYSQNGILHFKTSVAGKIVVSFNDTGSSASATAVKRYLVVNDVQTEYWTSRENNSDEAPYAAQLNVTSGEIEVPAGDVTIKGSSAIQVSKIVFTPTASPEPAQVTSTYVFTAKNWTATKDDEAANWTSVKAGAGFNNNGVQVTTAATGASATSPDEYDNISKIVVTYNTNKSAGEGTLDVKIGANEAVSKVCGYSGSDDGRTANFTAEFDYATPQSGAVMLTANTTTNSIYVVSIAITHAKPAAPAVEKPTFSLAAGTYAGAQKVEIACATEDAKIYYTTDGTEPTAESTEYTTTAIDIAVTTTVKAIAIKGDDKSKVAEATYTIIEKIDGGTAAEPLTIAQAKALIDTKDADVLAHADNKVYVKGKISQVDKFNESYGSIQYWISEDGTTTDQFEVYSGLGLNGAKFTAKEDVVVGADVVIFGNIKKFVSGETAVYEFDKENQQVSYVGPVKDITLAAADITEGNITAAYEAAAKGYTVGKLTITLAEGNYTVTKSLVATSDVAINGAAGAKIDASALTGAFINYATVNGVKAKKADDSDSDYTIVDNVTVKDVEITGLAKSFINNAAGKVLFKKVLVDNVVAEFSGSNTIFALANGYPEDLKITNSTLWSKAGHTGFLFQAHGKAVDINADYKTSWTIDKSTLYQIGVGKKVNNTNVFKGKNYLVMTLTNSVLYNFGSNVGNEVNGWQFGQNSTTPTMTYANNTYWSAEGAVAGWTDASKSGSDQTGTALTTDPGFDAEKVAAGDFTIGASTAQALMKTGDPRWLIDYVAPATAEAKDIVLDAEKLTAAGNDIGKAFVAEKYAIINALNSFSGKVTVTLAADGVYTISSPIEAASDVAINGAAGAKIDASALTGAFINYATVNGVKAKKADETESNYTVVDNVTVKDVEITGLAKSFINNAAGNVCFTKIAIDNAVVETSGSNALFALGNGYPVAFEVTNSTLYSKTSHTGFFIQAQGRPKDATGTTSFKVDKSTLVNIAVGKKANNNNSGIRGQTITALTLTNNILVNFGSNVGNEVNGWLFGQNSTSPALTYANNTYWSAISEGAAVAGWTDASKSGSDQTGTALTTDPGFDAEKAAAGDFTIGASTAQAKFQTGDPRWVVEYVDPNLLWSSETAVTCGWAGEIQIAAAKLANVKVGDKIHVAVEGVTPANEYDAVVALMDGAWASLEQNIAVGLGDKDDVAFTVTGDIKRLIQANGMMISGIGFSSKKVWLEPATEALGSDNSIFVGSRNNQLLLNVCHFLNVNDKTGVAAGDKLVVTCTAIDPAPESVWFVLSDGNWSDLEGVAFTDIEGGKEYTFTAEVAELAKSGGLIINQNGYIITQVELVPAPKPEDIEIAAADIVEGDITAAIAAASEGKIVTNITINLAAETAYKVTAPIVAPASITINGNGATIDASELTGNFIEMAVVENPTEWTEANVTVKELTVKGLKKALFYSACKNYFGDVTVDKCVVEQAADATTFDYTKGSTAVNFTVTNSTFYAPAATTKSFYSSQSGQKTTEYNNEAVQTFTFTNNTMYNLAPGKNFFTHRQNNQKWLTYDVKNNIFVNCGKSGQVIKGMNGGGSSANPVWDIDGNVFNFDGADTSAAESTGDEAEPVKNSIAGVIAFTDAANGDFNATLGTEFAPTTEKTEVGDPRWTVTNVQIPSDIVISPAEGDIAAALTAACEGKLVKNITINLTENVTYTVGATLIAPYSITINGNGAIIDASALEGNMIEFAAKAAEDTEWTNADVAITAVTVKGLKKALFYSNSKYYYGNFTLINSSIEQAADATTFDYTKGSVALNFTIAGSTIYAPTATTKSLYSSQSGQKATEYNADATQNFVISVNTMYNLAKGKNFFTHRQSNQKWLTYDVKNNIFVNCGKSGQTIKGMNGGQGGANPTWTIKGNAFNFDGADTSAAEATGDADHTQDETPGLNETVQDNVAGVMTFTNVETPDFGGTFEMPFGATAPEALGDNRWTITFTNAPETFAITKTATENGSFVVKAGETEVTEAAEGTEITIIATPAEGYELEAITVKDADGADVTVTDGKFTMPAKAVTVSATFKNATGINSIAADKLENATIYTISGQRVEKAQKGLYIINGKKVVIK